MAIELGKFIYLGGLCGQLGFEVGTHLQKFFGLLPFFDISVATMLAITLHDPLGQVEVLAFDLKLCEQRVTFLRQVVMLSSF